ncbi:MAG: polyprenyl synthetase family protein [Jatrophihabitans sp.]
MSKPQSDTDTLVARIEAALRGFLDEHCAELRSLGADLNAMADAAADLVLAGGKRIRPQFAYWGWRCVHHSGADGEERSIVAAASLELLHAAALVHDDLIDASATRRGRPAAHTRFAALALAGGAGPGEAAAFGSAAAILLGDQLLSWSAAMLATSGPVPIRSTELFGATAQEIMAGQYLDVLAQVSGGYSVEAALRVARFKSAKYSVERPLQFGAAFGNAGPETLNALSAFGLPLGEGFQLRDDVLGVFGDPALTGKPAGDDLREGKRTVLVSLAHQSSDEAGRREPDTGLGNADLDAAGIDRLRDIIVSTAALESVEEMIADRVDEARTALADAVIRPDARRALSQLVDRVTTRTA